MASSRSWRSRGRAEPLTSRPRSERKGRDEGPLFPSGACPEWPEDLPLGPVTLCVCVCGGCWGWHPGLPMPGSGSTTEPHPSPRMHLFKSPPPPIAPWVGDQASNTWTIGGHLRSKLIGQEKSGAPLARALASGRRRYPKGLGCSGGNFASRVGAWEGIAGQPFSSEGPREARVEEHGFVID